MTCIFVFLALNHLTLICNNPHNFVNSLHGPKHKEYQNALDSSLVRNEPVLLHFASDNCPNPVKMKELLAADSITRDILTNYIYLELNVSDRTPLAKGETYTNESGMLVTTIGARNADLEMTVYHENVQPYLVIVDGFEEIVTSSKFIPTSEDLRKFLLSGIRKITNQRR